MLNFATVYQAALVTLAQQAEEEFGGGKGVEKKKWVLEQFGKALDAAGVAGLGKAILIAVAGLVIDFAVKKGLEKLGK